MTRPNFALDGMAAVVTGASSGIAAEIARHVAGSGARTVLVARDEGRLAQVAGEIRDDGGDCVTLSVDVNDDDAPERIVQASLDAYGALDILVNGAGIYVWGPYEQMPVETFDAQWATNVRAPYRLTQAALPHLKPEGVVINISSIAGIGGFPESVAYCTTKGAITNMTKAMAMELAPHGVRVNAIAPGEIDTPMNIELYKNPDYIPFAIEQTPAGRLGYPDDVAPTAVFLASPAAKFIHGEVIVVDGGWTAK